MRHTTLPNPNQRGFTLLETTIALFIMTIVGLGAASLFAFSIQNNSGATDRTQALALVQQQLELLRNARFSALDSEADGTWILRAGTRTQDGVLAGGRSYQVTTAITNTTATLKLITISVTPQGEGPDWAGTPVAVSTNRAKTR
ncbi:MAG: hypothetical protein QOD75_3555 [Blastocatellia bacterium]|jgi:prepilin-type N-terminal cleavage/methylation domain-containing protein|nr:hypothetical protein [Blastocatellia bacterium]